MPNLSALYASLLDGTATIQNSGAGIAYPIWTITGPGRSVVLRNLSSGAFFALDYEIGTGGHVVVNCTPYLKTVVDDQNQNLSAYLRAGSAFWGLLQGANSIEATLGWTASTSKIILAWTPS